MLTDNLPVDLVAATPLGGFKAKKAQGSQIGKAIEDMLGNASRWIHGYTGQGGVNPLQFPTLLLLLRCSTC